MQLRSIVSYRNSLFTRRPHGQDKTVLSCLVRVRGVNKLYDKQLTGVDM